MKKHKNSPLSSLYHFWKRILSLPFGRKLSFFSSLLTIAFLFFPWFYEGSQSISAFGKTFVFACIILSFHIFSILIILREVFSHVSTLGRFQHSDILLFIFAQSLFTIILANASLSTLLLEKPEYELSSVGMMITFVALGIGLAGVFFSKDFIPESSEKKQVFVDKDIDLSDSEMTPVSKLSLGDYTEEK